MYCSNRYNIKKHNDINSYRSSKPELHHTQTSMFSIKNEFEYDVILTKSLENKFKIKLDSHR